MSNVLRRICVFCGSSPGANPLFMSAARELGAELARQKIGLVYGGASVGMMGAIAEATMQNGGEVIGVVPRDLVKHEIAKHDLTELRIVGSMHERKALMADLADGFIMLPGGLGTYEEFFEALTWAQLRFHTKPCALVNTANFYDYLLQFLDHAVAERLVRAEYRQMVLVAQSATEAIALMREYVPWTGEKWMDRNNETGG